MAVLRYIFGWFGYVQVSSGAVRVSETLLEYLQAIRPIVAQHITDVRGHDALIEFQQALIQFLKTGRDINEQQNRG